jgi:hypothetical protein
MTEKNNKFVIYVGNYADHVRQLLLKRNNWEEIENNDIIKYEKLKNINFIWKMTNFPARVCNRYLILRII